MNKKKIVLILLAIFFGSYVGWQLFMPSQQIINIYKWRYDEMSKLEYLQALRDFCKNDLNNPIENLNYIQLIAWEHKYLVYTTDDFTRHDMPLDILRPYIGNGIAYGRCGEFSLCLNGLLLANGYKTRLIVDMSQAVTRFKFTNSITVQSPLNLYSLPNHRVGQIINNSIIVEINGFQIENLEKEKISLGKDFIYFTTPPQTGSVIYVEYEYYKNAGNHVWIEVWDNDKWIHIDPTEQRFDDKLMYYNDWNKEINDIKAITKNSSDEMIVIDVTQDYIPKP